MQSGESKIIFLDVDGVLCTRRAHLAFGKEGGMWFHWDQIAATAIKRAVIMGAKIVVSSTWRMPAHEEDFWHQAIAYGIGDKSYYHADWKTPITGESRGMEIDAWLKAHPQIRDFRIIDDDSDMLAYQCKHFIHTHGEEGMTSDNIKKLLNWAGVLKS